jgi:ACS family hexuronate transporter-like MFS transporter
MTTDATHLRSRFRWVICFIIFLATAIIYMDRQILSLLFPLLQKKFNWTNTDYALLNAWYQGGYALGLLGFGWLIDRVGIKIGYGASLFFWGIAAACHALVVTIAGVLGVSVFFALKGLRAFLGISEGGNFPAAIKTVGQWFPKTERAFATSMLNSGANVGALFAPAVVSWLVYHFAWQAPFAVASVAGFTWVVIWWLVYASPQNHPRVSSSELIYITEDGDQPARQSGEKTSWIGLLRFRATWAYVVGKFLTDPVWYFYLVWLPDFFKKTRGLDLKGSWPHLVTIYALITALSLVGGWLTGHLLRLNWSLTASRKTGLFCFALLVLPIVFVANAGDWTAVVLIGLAGAAHQAWSSTLFTTVSDMFPNRAVASVVGIGSMAGCVGSICFQLFCGHILDNYGAAGAHQSYALLFGYCSGAYLVAFVLHHLLVPKFKMVDC